MCALHEVDAEAEQLACVDDASSLVLDRPGIVTEAIPGGLYPAPVLVRHESFRHGVEVSKAVCCEPRGNHRQQMIGVSVDILAGQLLARSRTGIELAFAIEPTQPPTVGFRVG